MDKETFQEAKNLESKINMLKMKIANIGRAKSGCGHTIEFTPAGSHCRNSGTIRLTDKDAVRACLEVEERIAAEELQELEKEFDNL